MENPTPCCIDCEAPVARKSNRGPWPKRCAAHVRTAPKYCRTCGAEATGARRRGGRIYCSDGCLPRCSIAACQSRGVKRGWCESHYSQWWKKGAPRTLRKISPTTEFCQACARRNPKAQPKRGFCSRACYAFFRLHDGKVPTTFTCVLCEDVVDLMAERTKAGWRKRSTSRMCTPCAKSRRYGASVVQLVKRDGSDCRICDMGIDLALKFPDPFSVSIDHVMPRAKGGSDAAANLQLAHLRCNIVKRDKLLTAS